MFDILIFTILIILIYIYIKINNDNNLLNIKFKTNTFIINKDEYKIEKSLLLSKIIENMYYLKNHLVKNINNFNEYFEYINLLDKNFTKSRTIIYETNSDSNFTSYSVNKGEQLSLCLKNKRDGQLHDLNLLMYVAIHEMSHFACPEIGHGHLFHKIFKKFIEESIKIKIYNYIDFNNYPVEYCGMLINTSII